MPAAIFINREKKTKMFKKSKRVVPWLLTLAVLGSSLMTPARAALVATEEMVAPSSAGAANAARGRIQAWLAREDVSRQLQEYGVSAQDTQMRVAALTDEEARALAGKLDALPAGGDVIGVLFVVFVVLLVTDILGLTKIFPFTRSIK